MEKQLLIMPSYNESYDMPNVLTVDDDPDIRIALTDLLSHEGYAVTVVGTGQAALDLSEHHQFHAVILDLGLPDRNGFDVLSQMLARDPDLPIIILSAYSPLERFMGHQAQSRAFAFLSKPFDRKQLKDTLHRAIQSRNPLIPERKL